MLDPATCASERGNVYDIINEKCRKKIPPFSILIGAENVTDYMNIVSKVREKIANKDGFFRSKRFPDEHSTR